MVEEAAQPVSGADVAAADELAEIRWLSLAGVDELMPGIHEPAREYLRRIVVSPLRWAAVVLAAVALCVLIGLAIASHLGFVLIGIMVVFAVAVTYFAGRLDKRRP